jgi:hypothetical protein
MQSNTNWMMIINISIILWLGDIIGAPSSGIMSQIGLWVAPLSNLPPLLLIGVFGLICVLITNATSSFLPLFMLAPVGISVLGHDPRVATMMLVMIVVIAFSGCALPSGNTIGIMLHMQKGLFTPGKVIKYTYCMTLIVVITQFIGMLVTQFLY